MSTPSPESAGDPDPRPAREVTPTLLRSWPLPSPSGSKYGRGQVLIVGGAARTPGAVQLAGLAALRVGAGHLTMAGASAAAVAVAGAPPEGGGGGLAPSGPRTVVRGGLSAV